jgi:hypothetical protein
MKRNASEPIQLCLWGPTAAGKTALLAQLFLAPAPADGAWEVLPAAEAQNFVESTRQRMRQENRFPGVTEVGESQHLSLYFRRRGTNSMAKLTLDDHPGEYSRKFEPIGDALAAAEGLVLLLDPTFEPALLEGYLRRTLERLSFARGELSGRDPRPIAVCLSKADLRIRTPDDLAGALEEPEAFVRRWLDPRHLAPLPTYCERFRLFPVSAIGVRLRWGAVEPVVFVDESGEDRLCPHAAPVNLLAPFTWVLDQLSEG